MRAVRSCPGDARELSGPGLSLSPGKGQHCAPRASRTAGTRRDTPSQWKERKLRHQFIFQHLNTNKFYDREYLAEDSSSELLFDRTISLQRRPEVSSEQRGRQEHTGDGLKPINFTSKRSHFSFDLTSWFVFFTGFVTSKKLAIKSYNKAHRMAQNYKTSEKVTAFYCLSNKR